MQKVLDWTPSTSLDAGLDKPSLFQKDHQGVSYSHQAINVLLPVNNWKYDIFDGEWSLLNDARDRSAT